MSSRQVGGSVIRLSVLLVLVSITALFLVTVLPLDPLETDVGQAALRSMGQEQIAQFEEYWGVSAPSMKRYMSWAGDFLQGDMRVSLLYRRPVSKVIGGKLADSLWLMISAWVTSDMMGLVLGVAAGTRKGRLTDKLISGYILVTTSAPAFWLTLVLLMVFVVQLKILSIGFSVPIGMEASTVTLGNWLVHDILPVATLPITGTSSIALHTREKVAEAVEDDYVLFARARGEPEWEIVKRREIHSVLLPAMTLQFVSVSEIFGDSVLVKRMFSYPGLGHTAVTAGLGGDVPLLLDITMISATIMFGGNLAANVLYQVVDLRIRKRRAG